MPCEVVPLSVDFFKNGCRCHGNGQNAKIEKKLFLKFSNWSPFQNGRKSEDFCILVTILDSKWPP
jgi:hypothetical protein